MGTKKMPERDRPVQPIRSTDWYAEADENEILDDLLHVLWAARLWQVIVDEDPEEEQYRVPKEDGENILRRALEKADHIPDSGDQIKALFNDTFFKDREEA